MNEQTADKGGLIWKNIFSGKSLKEGTVESLLSKIPAFAKLSIHQIKEVATIVHRREYRSGEVVFFQGDPGLGMYIIEDGQVSIRLGDEQGKEIAVLEEGDFFGELALLDEAPRSATAICKTDCGLVGFFRPDLRAVIEKTPQLGLLIVEELAEIVVKRLRAADKEIFKLRAEIEKIKQQSKEGENG